MLETEFDKMSPSEYIDYMFEHTDEDGMLYIPGWYLLDEPAHSFRCQLEWSLHDCDRLHNRFEKIYGHLEKIAEIWDDLSDDPEENRRLFQNDDVFETWNTYIRKYDLSGFDEEKLRDIADRIEIIEEIKKISKKLCEDQKIDNYEKSIMRDYLDVTVTKEEDAYYDRYLEVTRNQARSRVNNNICATSVLLHAKRVCRLMSLHAPAIVIDAEARTFAAAMVMNRFGKQKETVADSVRLRIEALMEMPDDELDELYRPRKMNSRKSLTPLFVYMILMEHSSVDHPLRQKEILDYLREYPYEIVIERKALSRIIHNLTDSGLKIHSDAKTGVWYESSVE